MGMPLYPLQPSLRGHRQSTRKPTAHHLRLRWRGTLWSAQDATHDHARMVKEDPMKTFDAFMTERGFTICGLARMTGFTKSQISEYKRGLHKPSRRSAQRIANALRLPLVTLLAEIPVRERTENHPKPP